MGFSRFEEIHKFIYYFSEYFSLQGPLVASGVPTLAAYVVGTKLEKMTGQIRKTAAKDALKQLQDEGLVLTGEAVDEVQA